MAIYTKLWRVQHSVIMYNKTFQTCVVYDTPLADIVPSSRLLAAFDRHTRLFNDGITMESASMFGFMGIFGINTSR